MPPAVSWWSCRRLAARSTPWRWTPKRFTWVGDGQNLRRYSPQGELDLPGVDQVAPVVVAIDAAGRLHWEDRPLSHAELEEQARELAARPDAELYIEADRAVAYDAVAQVLSVAVPGVP